MRIDKQIIGSILDDYLDDDDIYQSGSYKCGRSELVEKLVIELNHITETKVGLTVNSDRLKTAIKRYSTEMVECDEERDEIISACNHHSTTFHQETNGGHEPETICNICGKVLH